MYVLFFQPDTTEFEESLSLSCIQLKTLESQAQCQWKDSVANDNNIVTWRVLSTRMRVPFRSITGPDNTYHEQNSRREMFPKEIRYLFVTGSPPRFLYLLWRGYCPWKTQSQEFTNTHNFITFHITCTSRTPLLRRTSRSIFKFFFFIYISSWFNT